MIAENPRKVVEQHLKNERTAMRPTRLQKQNKRTIPVVMVGKKEEKDNDRR